MALEEERFWKKAEPGPTPSACWAWSGARTPPGYSMFRPVVGGPPVYAHRWAYERWIGPIPEGFHVDHVCRNRGCTNPEHLEAVEPIVNFRRREGWTQTPDGWLCGQGHPVLSLKGSCPTCFAVVKARFKERHPDYANEYSRRHRERKRSGNP